MAQGICTVNPMAGSQSSTLGYGMLAAACLLASFPVWPDTFSAAHYDPKTDELVVTIVYGGSNPDHQFSTQWGECQSVPGGGKLQQTVLDVLDNQWEDVSQQMYTKTVRFSLAGLSCRPAMVTLRIAPKYEMTLKVP